MTRSPERFHAVWLHERYAGTLRHREDAVRFSFSLRYLDDPDRPVLGLNFEQDLRRSRSANVRLPPWFSNLLPEGHLLEWVARDRDVSPRREMELLLQVGHDLPGAVRVSEDDGDPVHDPPDRPSFTNNPGDTTSSRLRFSLAGVALKFSVMARGNRLTLPAAGAGGDWIVKLPDRRYPQVPANEYAMMQLAASAGLDVPATRLVHRDDVDGIDDRHWHDTEQWAYAVQRFDRTPERGLVHIEDLAQVRGFYPEAKYTGNYESVAAYIYRRSDIESLREFTRRMIVIALISNGDAHLKNWSLLYPDRRIPRIAPAYDLVSTLPYMGDDESLALRFAGSKDFGIVRPSTFSLLDRRLGANADLADVALETVRRVQQAWPVAEDILAVDDVLRSAIGASLNRRTRAILGSTPSP